MEARHSLPEMDLVWALEKAVSSHLHDPTRGVWELLQEHFARYYAAPVHSMVDLQRRQRTRDKGMMFEQFAKRYLSKVYGLAEVWLLQEAPDEVLGAVGLKRHDLGVDLLGRDAAGRFYAVQAKYRTPNRFKSKSGLSWQTLSTFYALVNRTGPYHRHIVITNADYVRHVGQRSERDVSICGQRLQNLPLTSWAAMTTWVAHQVGTGDAVDTIGHAVADNSSDEEERDDIGGDNTQFVKCPVVQVMRTVISAIPGKVPSLHEREMLREARLRRFG